MSILRCNESLFLSKRLVEAMCEKKKHLVPHAFGDRFVGPQYCPRYSSSPCCFDPGDAANANVSVRVRCTVPRSGYHLVVMRLFLFASSSPTPNPKIFDPTNAAVLSAKRGVDSAPSLPLLCPLSPLATIHRPLHCNICVLFTPPPAPLSLPYLITSAIGARHQEHSLESPLVRVCIDRVRILTVKLPSCWSRGNSPRTLHGLAIGDPYPSHSSTPYL